MRRLLLLLIPLVLITFGLLSPLVFDAVTQEAADISDPVVISEYRANFAVTADGRLDAAETITAEFPSGRHGLFRYWDVANPNVTGVRQRPQITSILLDGEPAKYQMLWENGTRFRVAKIGDPDAYLRPGTHVFEIRYTIDGVLDPANIGDDKRFAGSVGQPRTAESVFFWNVIAPSWNNYIERADISIKMPGDVPSVQCSVGHGVGRPCRGLTVSARTVQLSAVNLPPRTPVTVRAEVDVPTPPRTELPWPQRWDGVLGDSVAGLLWVAGLTLAAVLIATLWYGRILETPPGFPLQYSPPDGLGPVQLEYIRTEDVPANGLTATLFHLADRGLIELRQISAKHWKIRGIADQGAWADVDPVAVAVGSKLKVMGPGREFDAKKTVKSGERLSAAKTDMAAAVRNWAFDEKLLVKKRSEWWLRVANVAAFVAMMVCFFRWFGIPNTLWALPFAAFFLFTTPSWLPGVGTRRTAAGRELWSRAGGFHRLLATDSAESRFDFAARRDLYTAYIPFAVAAGAAALWAKKYEAVMGEPAPQPDWYHSSSSTGWGFSSSSGGGGDFDSFESALSSSIGAYTASQSSSSSSSGGGGDGETPFCSGGFGSARLGYGLT
ncbi:DUF2207 domain-containing protein, partial [Mycolicibacterium elephantis]|uniref:DUF2207 domain-containing protein n=1 Tax=Mycolicibacterium elephantis TaxID=81858 RepID=UPI000A593F90